MRDDDTVDGDPAIRAGSHELRCFKRDLSNAAVGQPKEAGAVKVDEGRVGAGDSGNLAPSGGNTLGDDWRSRVGFVGHDNLPWLWEPSKQDWVPVTETRHAGAYAAMQKRA